MKPSALARLAFFCICICSLHASAAAVTSADYCTCLVSGEHDSKGRRDSGLGVSLIVPPDAKKRLVQGADEGAGLSWRDSDSEVSYSFYPKRASDPIFFDHPPDNECVVSSNHHRVLIEAIRSATRAGMVAKFDEDSGQSPRVAIVIRARNRSTVCKLGATAIWSAIFNVDAIENLRLLRISRDRRYFMYRNETGAVMKARVGDVVSRGYGKVKSIFNSHVVVDQMVSDDDSGWRIETRTIDLTSRLMRKCFPALSQLAASGTCPDAAPQGVSQHPAR